MLHSHGFAQFMDKPTQITQTSETCIDHIFIRNRCLSIFKSEVFDIHLTDHCLLGLKIDSIHEYKKSISANSTTELLKIDFDMLNQKLRSIDWNYLYNEPDVNVCFNGFHEVLLNMVDSCKMPVSYSNKLRKAVSISPWINQRLLAKLSKRKKLYCILKRRPYDINFKNYFKQFCNRLTNDINETKNRFYANQIEQCQGDSAMQWKVINRMTGRGAKNGVEKVELVDGEIILEPERVAEEINKYFIAAQSDVVDNRGYAAPQPAAPFIRRPHSFFVSPTTVNEVFSTIQNLKNKKSSGFDSLNVCLLKKIAQSISPILSHIINLSFLNGIFPEKLKLSGVVPIYKKTVFNKN